MLLDIYNIVLHVGNVTLILNVKNGMYYPSKTKIHVHYTYKDVDPEGRAVYGVGL